MTDALDDFLALAGPLAAAPLAQGRRPVRVSLLSHHSDEAALTAAATRATAALAGSGVSIASWTEPDPSDDHHQPLGLDIDVDGPDLTGLLEGVADLCVRLYRDGAAAGVATLDVQVPCADASELAARYAALMVRLTGALGDPDEELRGHGWTHLWEQAGDGFVQAFGHVVQAGERVWFDIQLGGASVTIPRADLGAFAPAAADVGADIAFTRTLAGSALPLIRLGGPDAKVRFHAAINAFRDASPHGFCLMPWAVEDYADHALFLTPDGQAGLAVGADGMLHSVFSSPSVRATHGFQPGEPSPGDVLTDLALRMGARELNCFDNGVTRQFYERHGYRVTARFPFDPDQAIPGWRYGVYAVDGREPDFLVMTHR